MEFIKALFKCESCSNDTSIFFEFEDKIEGIFEKITCTICKVNKIIGVGDLGYRTDIPNPDYPPFQAQFIRIALQDAICETCQNEHNMISTHKLLRSNCYSCGSEMSMKVTHEEKCNNPDLERLLIKLHASGK